MEDLKLQIDLVLENLSYSRTEYEEDGGSPSPRCGRQVRAREGWLQAEAVRMERRGDFRR